MTKQICYYLDSTEELEEILSNTCSKGCDKCNYWHTCIRDEPGWSVEDIVAYTPVALATILRIRGDW